VLQPEDVIILDGGEFCQWMRLGLRDLPNRVLWNSRFGGIGGSIPMAVGVAAADHPGRTIALLGDGAAGYHLSELETATRCGLPLVTIIGNDARWAAEWFQQVNLYGPNRTFETALSPARYDQVAVALGAAGTQVTERAALGGALADALSAPGPVCLNVHILSLPSPAVEA
jgi:acetolactate synthase-1/2/3 large subunit